MFLGYSKWKPIKQYTPVCHLGTSGWVMVSKLDLCYIIKEWFFYFNPFSLIIFYHSVWLGFELFSSWFRCTDIGYSFTLTRKGYDNHNCHNKSQIGNVAGVWMTSCPEVMVLRIWRFWKRVSWELTLDHLGRQLGSLTLRQTFEVEDLRLDHKAEMNWSMYK